MAKKEKQQVILDGGLVMVNEEKYKDAISRGIDPEDAIKLAEERVCVES
jgi:rRNA processing protein Krr1/Pno1